MVLSRTGSVLVFRVSGSVTHGPGRPRLLPDGGMPIRHAQGAENGMGGLVAPINALVGVFLGKG